MTRWGHDRRRSCPHLDLSFCNPNKEIATFISGSCFDADPQADDPGSARPPDRGQPAAASQRPAGSLRLEPECGDQPAGVARCLIFRWCRVAGDSPVSGVRGMTGTTWSMTGQKSGLPLCRGAPIKRAGFFNWKWGCPQGVALISEPPKRPLFGTVWIGAGSHGG